ncbi:MAG: hypothetical protein U5Q44_15405 [Dehalococcoidia bacterium]|nr:hypothetical protein [Dehalococcoidia bacterium]
MGFNGLDAFPGRVLELFFDEAAEGRVAAALRVLGNEDIDGITRQEPNHGGNQERHADERWDHQQHAAKDVLGQRSPPWLFR